MPPEIMRPEFDAGHLARLPDDQPCRGVGDWEYSAAGLYSPILDISMKSIGDFPRDEHEFAIGITPMKIFLSHKGADKPSVREFKKTLELLGFDPWLDEDAMQAGTELERALLSGFSDSCAAVFFVTPNFVDENYLATEVDYAIQEKRKKGDKFAIVTLVFSKEGAKGTVPGLLHRYVWKEPSSDLEALSEITKALPVQVGPVYWKVA